jgi:hypothetical protein
VLLLFAISQIRSQQHKLFSLQLINGTAIIRNNLREEVVVAYIKVQCRPLQELTEEIFPELSNWSGDILNNKSFRKCLADKRTDADDTEVIKTNRLVHTVIATEQAM